MKRRLAPLLLGMALLASGGDHVLCVSTPSAAERWSAPSCHPAAGADHDAATPGAPLPDDDPAACAVACGQQADLPAAGPARPHLRPERAEPAEPSPSLPLLSSGIEHIPLAP